MWDFITLYGNLLFTISTVITLGFFVVWIRDPNIPSQTRAFLLNIATRDLAVALRITWWTVALALAPTDCIPGVTAAQCSYHPLSAEWKWLPTILAGMVYFMADLHLIKTIQGISFRSKVAWLAGGHGAAASFALLVHSI